MARLHEASVDLKFRRAMQCQRLLGRLRLRPFALAKGIVVPSQVLHPLHPLHPLHRSSSQPPQSCQPVWGQYFTYIFIYKESPSDGRPPGSVDGRPRSPPSAWLEDLLERLPSKSSKHTKQVCQSHQASLSSKSSKQVFHPSTCLEDLLGRLARETCLGDLIGRIARRIYLGDLPGRLARPLAKRTPF